MTGGTGVATVDGGRIAYRRAGTDGPPVVLLHGGGVDDSTLSWRYAIDALAEADYRVYALDWPGYGDSENGTDHSVDGYASVLDGFLDSIHLDRATLVGISMGGAVALGYALEHPDRVTALGLVDSYGLGPRVRGGTLWRAAARVPGANAAGWAAMAYSNETARLGLGSVVADSSEIPPGFVEDIRRRASEPGAGRAFEAFQRNEIGSGGRARTNYAGELGSVEAPTLLVHGAKDPLFPVDWSRRAARRLRDAELEILHDCGHWPTRERPRAFNEVLLDYLERTDLD